MASLRIYTVHINPSLSHPYESAEFVQEGFTFKAFAFTSLWALYHRLWLPACCLLAYNACIGYLAYCETFSWSGVAIIDFGGHLIIGFHATDWLRAKLARQGYLTADITAGDTILRAEQRFFDRYFSTHAAA